MSTSCVILWHYSVNSFSVMINKLILLRGLQGSVIVLVKRNRLIAHNSCAACSCWKSVRIIFPWHYTFLLPLFYKRLLYHMTKATQSGTPQSKCVPNCPGHHGLVEIKRVQAACVNRSGNLHKSPSIRMKICLWPNQQSVHE